MQQYQEYIQQQLAEQKRLNQIDAECIHCPKCNSQWFEEITVQKFKVDHNVILGQHVPPKPGSMPYYILKCTRCGDLLEPRIIHNTRDIGGNDYDDLLDTLEGKGDSRQPITKTEDPQKEIDGLKERIALLEEQNNTKEAKPSKKPVKGKKKLEVPVEKL